MSNGRKRKISEIEIEARGEEESVRNLDHQGIACFYFTLLVIDFS